MQFIEKAVQIKGQSEQRSEGGRRLCGHPATGRACRAEEPERPGVLTCPRERVGQGTRRQRGWSGLRTGVEAGLGTEPGKVRLC